MQKIHMKYFDITDLVIWFSDRSHPSGVQRVSIEALRYVLSNKLSEIEVIWFKESSSKWMMVDKEFLLINLNLFKDYKFFKQSNLEDKCLYFVPKNSEIYSIGMSWWNRQLIQFHDNQKNNNKLYIYLHDIIPTIYPVLVDKKFIEHWNDFLINAFKYADEFIVSTYETKRLIERLGNYNLTPPPIRVIPYGIDHLNQGETIKLNYKREKIILNLGTIDTRKNQIALIKAWKEVGQEIDTSEWMLMFVGGINDQRVGSLDMEPNIYLLNDLSDGEVNALLNISYASIFPTLAEGFCFPAFETATHGLRTFVTNLKEISENGKGYMYFMDDVSPSAIIKILKIIFNLYGESPFPTVFNPEDSKLTWKLFCNNLFNGDDNV